MDIERIGRATSSQRRSLYRFLLADRDDVRLLLQNLTVEEASEVLAALVAADRRRVVAANEAAVLDDLLIGDAK